MNCIIIDDNELAIKTLKSMIVNFCPNVSVIGSSQNIANGVKLINELSPDIVFLDVEIKNEMGFDLFSFFPKPTFSVIFTTAHEKYAYMAIKSKFFDYLLKPIDPTELVKTIASFEFDKKNKRIIDTSYSILPKRIAFIINNQYVFIGENDIIYLKADGKYTDVIMKNNKIHKSSKNLGEIELLLSENFFKCHKGCIINMNFISKFIKDDLIIVLSDNSEIDLAARRKEAFLNLFYRL